MAGKPRRTTGNTRIPDDASGRRSIIVPDEIWQHVQRWAKEEDKSEAAVVRSCIEGARRKELIAIELYDTFRHLSSLHNNILQEIFYLKGSVHKITGNTESTENIRNDFEWIRHLIKDVDTQLTLLNPKYAK